ncbi:MAG: hypothetical protein PHW76_00775 [Alphaproteobacteria bacterium]|nr:hypothetical protein [Alphaproteobacteria bacterium]
MNIEEVIKQAQADGVVFRIAAPEGLKVAGKPEVVERWLPVLRPQKPAILDALLRDEHERIMRCMVEWNERAALMTNASTTSEQAEAMAWNDLDLDAVFFGLYRAN